MQALLYLHVQLEDGINGKGKDRGISLKQFQALTSGPGIGRRALIRELWYFIVVPFDLPDWMACKTDGYTTNNAVRRANDAAFQSAVINLFNTLDSWDKDHRLSVVLLLQGREPGQEPSTEKDDEAGLYTWDYTDGRTRSVPVYRAQFHDNGASMLRDVSCIDKIELPVYNIWAGAAMQIVRHCPQLTELRLEVEDDIRPDHLEYIKERRQAVSEGLRHIPSTLRVFHFENGDESNWKDTMPALNVLSSNVDFLSISIRDLSLSLLSAVASFWCMDSSSHSRGEAMIAAIDDWEAEICDSERGWIQRPIFEQEQFHRLFISLGYAARRMPRLRAINLILNHSTNLRFWFSNTAGSFSAEWELRLCDSYKPDDRVAAAWGFHLDDLLAKRDGLQLIATLPHWPLVEGKSIFARCTVTSKPRVVNAKDPFNGTFGIPFDDTSQPSSEFEQMYLDAANAKGSDKYPACDARIAPEGFWRSRPGKDSKDIKNGRTAVAPSESDDEVTRQMETLLLSNFLNPKYSDMTIKCDDEVFPAHRNIICPQSKYFEVACDGRFKKGDEPIRLDGQDPTLVKKTLEFLYTGNYTYEGPPKDPETEPTELLSENEAETSMATPQTGDAYFHAQMYARGVYFQIDALKSKAKQCFKESFMTDPDRDSFRSAVLEVYDSTVESDRGLRDLVVQLTTDNLSLLRAKVNPVLDDNLLEDVPSFMRDICLSAVERCAEFQRDSQRLGRPAMQQFGARHYA
ncbi:hypothetical protein CFD26_106509 [Aspergillus turcosus]|uniref:BTB domain-containing protein n=1 Tax=Aspergillus turcosus TaxID=1245748 RepID=A0A421D5T8_9EURO|nr:hypothetical protein CFD26_106509 [Aspergillus turcosus]